MRCFEIGLRGKYAYPQLVVMDADLLTEESLSWIQIVLEIAQGYVDSNCWIVSHSYFYWYSDSMFPNFSQCTTSLSIENAPR